MDAIPEFLEAFDCPCYADEHVAQVISDPMAWRMPCISPSVAKMEKSLKHGESWQWHEFTLTSYFLPGQTLYHGGLLVEGQGLRMLFVGDSFTPAGIDDYCALNRNWLGPDVGFNACLDLIEKLRPTHIFNCHVAEAFNFTPEQCQAMRENLAEREKLFGDLVPWDHANYGMDESWIRTFPYEQQAKPGEGVASKSSSQTIRLNRAKRRATGDAAKLGPSDRGLAEHLSTGQSGNPTDYPPRDPRRTRPGRYPIPLDIRYGDRLLPQFTETIIVVN